MPYTTRIMNWDWDKLQEKRQRQKNTGPIRRPDNDDPSGESPFGGIDVGKYLPKFSSGLPVWPVVLLAAIVWLASGIFIVNPGEVGVVQRFGKYHRTMEEGLHYRMPFPIETRVLVNTKLLRTVVIGQASESVRFAAQGTAEESSMFTGDENIVHMHFNVQYSVDDAMKYLFNVKSPDALVRTAAEAAMREVVGSREIDAILTAERAGVQVRAQEVLETILSLYDSGIRIHAVQLLDVQPPAEVADAFKDVASAREDRVRIINQAEAYRNNIVPVANGTAKSMVNAATGYSRRVVLEAEGEAQRFLAMVAEYNKAKDITEKRLRLEAMQEVLSAAGIDKVVISNEAKGGFLPLMNLEKSGQRLNLPLNPDAGNKKPQGGQ